MKQNYQAWDLNLDFSSEMSDKQLLRHLVGFAVLAPSSHNSQPWLFSISENQIIVSPNLERELTASDPDQRQLYLSLGCAIQNLHIAADYYGLNFTETIEEKNGKTTAALRLTDKNLPVAQEGHLASFIPRRVTNRSNYIMEPLKSGMLSELETIAEKHQITLYKVSINHPHKQKIVDLIMDATNEAMERSEFRKELSEYLKPNTTSSPLGMPCFGMHIPTPVSLLAPTMMKHFNMGKLSEKAERKILEEHTPMFLILASKEDTSKEWIQVGKAYQLMALTCTKNDYATNPLAALIEIGEHYQVLQKLMNTNLRPLLFFRVGKPTKETKHSPRLTSESVIASV